MDIKESPRFTCFSCGTQNTIASTTWEGALDIEKDNDLADGWWLDICDATEEDVDQVSQALAIHPLTAEDVVIREPREKVEVFRNYYLISLQTLISSAVSKEGGGGGGEDLATPFHASKPEPAPFYILVFRTGVVTFSPSGCSHVARVRDRARKLHDPKVLSGDWICYAILAGFDSDDIVDSFLPYMESAERESEAIEDQVFTARAEDLQILIPRIDRLRKNITHLIRCLSGKHDVLNSFIKRCQAIDRHPVFPDGDLSLYLGDVQDHLVTTMTSLTHIDEIISRSQSKFLAQLSVTNLRLSLNINGVLSRVTVLATIFVPLHVVTGMFGMNVEVPGQEI
ncbi:magnesium and cobalt transport protein CorA [Aspergillus nanangensis]|uniref:Magnesium and cobalt transport protein CorA n=1 Tax=Aspergillus nanangensis TaxID=2582783 RepID=A0AAD4CGP9_ASPNN|nr:magnesium and cobalt transport protein CorA [Aspergillus nanangensis]